MAHVTWDSPGSNGRYTYIAARVDESAASVLTPEAIEQVLNAGGNIVADSVKARIRANAKKQTGNLESSISFDTFESGYVASSAVVMGWMEIPDPRKTRTVVVKMKNSKHGRTHTYTGRSSYVDRRGRRRYVRTVADYGRILEYSERRQLRHMEQGFIDAEEAATSKMEAMCDALLDKAVEAQMSKAGL